MNKPPLNIVIDSNILKRDKSLSKQDMLYLKDLSKLDLIKIHFPYFIYKECVSENIKCITEKINSAISTLKNINKQGLHIKESTIVEKLVSELESSKSTIKKSAESVWNEYIADAKAILHDFSSDDSKLVFDNYFIGNKPFTMIKSRKDIPDAFIFETLKRIAQKQELHFITEDNNLFEICLLEKNISVYKSLDELYKSEIFNRIKESHDSSVSFNKSKEVLLKRTDEIIKEIAKFLIKNITHFEIEDRYIPSENNKGNILKIEEIKNIEFVTSKILYTNERFYIPVNILSTCIIEYPFFSEYGYHRSELGHYRKITHTPIDDKHSIIEEVLDVQFQIEISIVKSTLKESELLEFTIEEYKDFKLVINYKYWENL